MKAHKGHILQVVQSAGQNALTMHENSYLNVDEQGRIEGVSNKPGAEAEIVDHGECWILPGFVDTHTHFPQWDIMGSYGEQLLEWLNQYTFPEEIKYQDSDFAEVKADLFCRALLRNGTTCAAIYSTNHLAATDTLFTAADKYNLAAWIGKSSMDRHGPEELLVENAKDRDEWECLIEKWYEKDPRRKIALTPRFAPTSTDGQLKTLGQLKEKYNKLKIQTHFAENQAEIRWVAELFPKHDSYLNVYDSFQLLGPDTILGHGIHITEKDLATLDKRQTHTAHCPTSNLFLGSGLFPKSRYLENGASFALASDVGAGTSLSMWKTMAAAYNVQKLQNNCFSAADLLASATRDGARCMGLDHETGDFTKGKAADFQVIDVHNIPNVSRRLENSNSLDEKVFSLIILGDERLQQETYAQGVCHFTRGESSK